MKELSVEEIKKIVNNVKGDEVMKQFGNHREFLFAGLDGKEEMKSRMAFADAYSQELEEIHKAQAINYARICNFRLALLINFGETSLQQVRLPNFRYNKK